jgi:hypothetical protein
MLIADTLLFESQVTPVHEVIEGAVQMTEGADRLQDAFHPKGTSRKDPGSAKANAHIATSSGLAAKDASGRAHINITAMIDRGKENGALHAIDKFHRCTSKYRIEIMKTNTPQNCRSEPKVYK